MNILLVDDEVLAIQYLAGLLDWEMYGYHISAIAHSVVEAKKLLAEQDINIVIFDVSMPEENGVVLSEYISLHYPHIGMLALSSYDNYDYVREILKNGAYDYILKHRVSPEQLLASLKAIESQLIHTPMLIYSKPTNMAQLYDLQPSASGSYQLALSLDQQNQILAAIKQRDAATFKQLLSVIYMQESMQSKTSRLMITKEILDFLAAYATKHALCFPYEALVGEFIIIVEQQSNETLLANLVLQYETLVSQLQQASSSHYVASATSYIDRFYYKNISLEKCARNIGVNASYLSRIFHQETNNTFSKYVSFVRIRMAKIKILQGCPLKQVASECGFRNYNYFFKVFKDVEGITPLGYMELELGKEN